MQSKILIIEDSTPFCKILEDLLKTNYKISVCHDGETGLQIARKWMPTLILLDILLPGIDGFEVLRQLKQDIQTRDIPVIIVTGLSDVNEEEKGLNLGAVDYIRKPLRKAIIVARVKTHVALYNYRLRIEQIALLDGLTGLFNRHSFDENALRVWEKSKSENTLISLMIIDVDFFKLYNDNYGHMAGDKALCVVAHILHEITDGTEAFAARYGGEEFVIILPRTGRKAARHFAEQVRYQIEERKIEHGFSTAASTLTASIGGSTLRANQKNLLKDFIQAADRKLYEAKNAGRNRVCWD